jgi:glycosyltransferase involved in cell wall biosynthesis
LRSINIALDARATRQLSLGMLRYIEELLHWLPLVAPDLTFLPFEEGEVLSYGEQVALPAALRRSSAAFVHHLSLYAPVVPSIPAIVTIHDLIHMRYPRNFKTHVQPYYHLVVRMLCNRARRIITDDEKTVEDLVQYLGVSREKIRVVPLGVGGIFLDPRFDEAPGEALRAEPPYLFYAGNHREHKDLATAIRAWAELPDELRLDFVLTGEDDIAPEWPRVRPNGARLRFLGTLQDARLASLLHGARALVYPSLCEGFGLPMLEALAVGTLVIASDRAIPEVLRSHAITFKAGDAVALRRAILTLLANDFQDRQRRRSYSANFTWERTARATAAVYREVLEELCGSKKRRLWGR